MANRLTRMCRFSWAYGNPGDEVDAGILRDRIANVEATRRSYQHQLDGGTPRHGGRQLPDKTLRENIGRCTARLAALRQQLASL